MSMDRRDFLKSTLASAAVAGMGGLSFLEGGVLSAQLAGRPASPVLKAFIVSDSHFGWIHWQQPPSDEIRQAMGRILSRFPDLDLFFDTGDAHHGNATDVARGEWTDIIANHCGVRPFYYTAGNHEIDAWGTDADPELRSNRLGSVACRPYYSFDCKGIHFIAFPELLMCSYISDESIEWLKLDLAVNSGRTTVILTHNSIKDTTLPHDDLGYRRLANSEEVFALLNRYPNVIAWMHGHNHTYEIVQKQGKFFVSNGRIGGFNPPYAGYFGKDNLGGIYFEVHPSGMTVRAYSATNDVFFDEMEHYAHLTQTMEVATSLNPAAPPAISYGSGGARDGERLIVRHHHVPDGGTRELFIAGAAGAILNDNADFATYTQRTIKTFQTKHLPGFNVEPPMENEFKSDESWQWLDPGLKLLAQSSETVSRTVCAPSTAQAMRAYYRFPPGRRYRVDLELDASQGGQRLEMMCRVFDNDMKQAILLNEPPLSLAEGSQTLTFRFGVPAFAERESIYTNPASDLLYQVMFQAKFSSLSDAVTLTRYEIRFDDAEGKTLDPAVTLGETPYECQGAFDAGQYQRFEIQDRPSERLVASIAAGGNRRLTWLVRQTGLAWQVRNAAVTDEGDSFVIGEMRNRWADTCEVVVAPMRPVTEPFVHRLAYIDGARVTPIKPGNSTLSIDVDKLIGEEAGIEIVNATVPTTVTGAKSWRLVDGLLTLTLDKPGPLTVTFQKQTAVTHWNM